MYLSIEVQKLCQRYHIRLARSRGQNFLIDEKVYDKIIQAADLTKNDTVLEIGPGLGFLTEALARRAGRVVSVEVDDRLVGVLIKRMKVLGIENVEVINEDILKVSNIKYQISNKIQIPNDKHKLMLPERYKMVANLPYNITSIFLRKFLSEVENKPKLMVLMLQKEVVERILAKPGQMSLLAVSVQFYARAEKIMDVPKENFWPQPQVDSAIVKLQIANCKLQNDDFIKKVDEKKFFRMVKIGFSAKRKQLQHNLAVGFRCEKSQSREWLSEIGLDDKVRAQGLSLDFWYELYIVLSKLNML